MSSLTGNRYQKRRKKQASIETSQEPVEEDDDAEISQIYQASEADTGRGKDVEDETRTETAAETDTGRGKDVEDETRTDTAAETDTPTPTDLTPQILNTTQACDLSDQTALHTWNICDKEMQEMWLQIQAKSDETMQQLKQNIVSLQNDKAVLTTEIRNLQEQHATEIRNLKIMHEGILRQQITAWHVGMQMIRQGVPTET